MPKRKRARSAGPVKETAGAVTVCAGTSAAARLFMLFTRLCTAVASCTRPSPVTGCGVAARVAAVPVPLFSFSGSTAAAACAGLMMPASIACTWFICSGETALPCCSAWYAARSSCKVA
ncbi:hypothetical protein [uncultured Bacteroides sp.]|uniref:hypothetical protein n=1 Tax=uncultured Bacteroides sp. TaxID=162156 RepID=UPI003455193E